jgi:hypothetical protein
MLLIISKLGLMVAAIVMVLHGVETAVKAARDAHQLWCTPQAEEGGKLDQ